MRLFKGWIVRVPFKDGDYPSEWEWVRDLDNNTTKRKAWAMVFASPEQAYEQASLSWEDVCLVPVYEDEE